jgi:hypothetical protein
MAIRIAGELGPIGTNNVIFRLLHCGQLPDIARLLIYLKELLHWPNFDPK